MSRARPAIVQICPAAEGGVHDFAACLAQAWTAEGIATTTWTLSEETDREQPLAARVGDRVAGSATGAPVTLLLHFSGYGYATRGLCTWLVDALRPLAARPSGRPRIVIVFHELFAAGPPWRSAFWLGPWQAAIAGRLAGLADAIWTNTEHHAGWLRPRAQPGAGLVVRPVFSNVGEPAALPQWQGRQPRAIVFGSAATRARALAGLRGREAMLRQLGVEELVEVGHGPACTAPPTALAHRALGRLDGDALTRALAESRFGLLDYPARYLGKSGVLAAYAAHGCAVLDTGAPGRAYDGLACGRDYIALGAAGGHGRDAMAATTSLAAMAARLHRWYADHRLSRQAQELLSLASGGSPDH